MKCPVFFYEVKHEWKFQIYKTENNLFSQVGNYVIINKWLYKNDWLNNLFIFIVKKKTLSWLAVKATEMLMIV